METNNLIRLASPLIFLMRQIRHTSDHLEVEKLRTTIIAEIDAFKAKLIAIHYPEKLITVSHYCLCCVLDEAVLSQVWGRNSVWAQGSLLSLFHKETGGGERFYTILEESLRDISHNIDFIELAYCLLSLGFEGKLYGDENSAIREQTRLNVFSCIQKVRIKPTLNLSIEGEKKQAPYLNKKRRKLLVWASIVSLLILTVILFLNFQAYKKLSPIMDELNTLAMSSPLSVFEELGAKQIQNPVSVLPLKYSVDKLVKSKKNPSPRLRGEGAHRSDEAQGWR